MAERLYRRRVSPAQVVSPEMASCMCQVSAETGRQLGVLLDRRGQPDHVVVGGARKLWLPDIGRLRAGMGRLRGLRLVHTHLSGEPLSSDDFNDLSLLRLDLVAAVSVTGSGGAGQIQIAHLLPENPEGKLWTLLPAAPVRDLELDFLELVQSLEEEFARASRARVQPADRGKDRALLVHVRTRDTERPEATALEELSELCRTAGVHVM